MCTEQSPAGNASFFLQPTRVWIACIWPKDMQRLKEIATLMAGFSTKNDLHSMKLPSWWSFPIGFARRQGPCTSCKHRPCCDSCLGEFATAGSTTYPQGSDCEARYFCRWHALSTDLIDLGPFRWDLLGLFLPWLSFFNSCESAIGPQQKGLENPLPEWSSQLRSTEVKELSKFGA